MVRLAAIGTAVALLLAPAQAHEDLYRLEILGCYDGDTCRADVYAGLDLVLRNQPLRLLGYDTPEIAGDCPEERGLALAARERLLDLIAEAREVSGRITGRDRYGRWLALLLLDGTSPAGALIGEGLARPYEGGRRAPWCWTTAPD